MSGDAAHSSRGGDDARRITGPSQTRAGNRAIHGLLFVAVRGCRSSRPALTGSRCTTPLLIGVIYLVAACTSRAPA